MGFAAIGIAVLTVVVLAFSVINWRGSFASHRASATDFLALALARSRARLRYIRFGGWLLVADVVVIAGAAMVEFRDEGFGRLPRHAWLRNTCCPRRGCRPFRLGPARAPARGAPRRHAACDATGNGEPR